MSQNGKYVNAVAPLVGIYYSSDFGHSWVSSTAPAYNWLATDSTASGQYVVAGVEEGAIYYSSNYGVN
jgi:hypothetical protein